LAGASPDTGNLGVSALCFSALRAIYEGDCLARVTVLDEGRGQRVSTFAAGDQLHRYHRCGERSMSRRIWQAESLWNIRVSSCLGGALNATSRAILSADAVLDATGGDSFTDLYGARRFRGVTMFKKLVLDQGVPLILLPQTYGPFAHRQHRDIARHVISRANVAWARDRRSFDVLGELLGDEFEPTKHHSGVDMAFYLESREPAAAHSRDWIRGLTSQDHATPLVGINISGLLFNAADGGQAQYGLRADYRGVIHGLIGRLLKDSDCRILLVPHVVTAPEHFESDVNACLIAHDHFRARFGDRISVQPAVSDPREAKWVIAQLQWFCGTRMHATIAALSGGVPTAAIAYSGKTLGVFETCEQGERVADPRKLDTAAMVEHLWNSFLMRSVAAESLRRVIPGVIDRARQQMQDIVRSCESRGNSRRTGEYAA
jgi:colanic acid/amylovoran biosynthesis protein